MDLVIEEYSEKSVVVRGNTKPVKDALKGLGGRFNPNLNGGAGWIFSKKKEDELRDFVENGVTLNLPGESNTLPVFSTPESSLYQTVKYKVYKPQAGMHVTLTVSGQDFEGVVESVETNDGIVDTAYVNFDDQTSLAVICRGKWTIFGYTQDHKLFFRK